MDSLRTPVSVIVTSYNHAEYLDQRLDSLLSQTYPNLEIIVVDDHSTDNSLAVLEAYKKYGHIRIVALEQNRGYANAVNFGVRLSRGAYIMFAECDDFNAPTHIETLADALACQANVGVAYCRSHLVDDRGKTFDDDFHSRERAFKAQCSKDTMVPQLMMQRFLLISCVIPNMSAALIRRDCFDRVNGISLAYQACADWDLWCRLSAGCDFYYVTACLNSFRTHATSVRSTSGVLQPMLEITDLLYAALPKAELSGWERFRFRVNLGFIWVSYAPGRLSAWLESFSRIWRRGRKYDSLNLFYLLPGIMKILALSIRGIFLKGGRA